MKKTTNQLFVLAITFILTACGGGGGGGGSGSSSGGTDSGSSPSNQSANGIWSGTSTIAGDGFSSDTLGLFYNGDFIAINFDFDEFYRGTYEVSDSSITGSGRGYIVNGPFGGTGTLSGDVTTAGTMRSSISTSLPSTANLELAYETGLYERSASRAIIAGSWDGYIDGLSYTITISSSGSVSASSSDGCIVSGSVSAPDSTRNIYRLNITIGGSGCPVPGNYEGLGALSDTFTENDTLNVGYSNNSFGFAYQAIRRGR